MKRYEVSLADGERHKVSAERLVVEDGAPVFYATRSGAAREEITAAWGAGAWRRVAALSEAGNPIARIGEAE